MHYRRPCNTRHTYTTLGLMVGANPAFMAKQLGHNLDVFFKFYARWIAEAQNLAEVAKINYRVKGWIIPESEKSAVMADFSTT